MQTLTHLEQKPISQVKVEVGDSDGPGRILRGVFETLDREGIVYCVLHGYEDYPQHIRSDVDIIISADVRPIKLAALFYENRCRIGADLVHFDDYHFILASSNGQSPPCFLDLDIGVDCEVGNLFIHAGRGLITSRRRYYLFWVPAANLEFICYLIRKIAKGQLNREHGSRLTTLYRQDTVDCRQQIGRFWGDRGTELIIAAATSGNWEPVNRNLGWLRAEVYRRAVRRHPWRAVRNALGRIGRRVGRICRPEGGLVVVLLGPDGAGKSSVVGAVRKELAGAFTRITCYRFPPGIINNLFRQPQGTETAPHATPPRSVLASVTRALLYWCVFYTFCYRLTVRLALAHDTLVIHDRHLVDALVDSRRYRYGGPYWLLRCAWQLMPKPDMIILLDAPPEVLQARKQEVAFEETARQRKAYLSLMETFKNGHIVDASRPLERVVSDVNDIILGHLTTRIVGRSAFRSGNVLTAESHRE